MCGIFAAIAKRKVLPILLSGLKALSYRGYDSAGVALLNNTKPNTKPNTKSNTKIKLVKACGKLDKLIEKIENQKQGFLDNSIHNLSDNSLDNSVNNSLDNSPDNYFDQLSGIAHTRWATHGKPTENNSHPHVIFDRIAVVHNGIIENYLILKSKLAKLGYKFNSDTDTEVIAAWLYHQVVVEQKTMLEALFLAKKVFIGNYAIVVMDAGVMDAEDMGAEDKNLYTLQYGCPLLYGLGVDEYYVSSDLNAFGALTSQYIEADFGEVAVISESKGIIFYDKNNIKIDRSVRDYTQENLAKLGKYSASKGGYKHYMLKEIMEQPQAILDTLSIRTDFIAPEVLNKIEHVHIVACGTSYYAGCVAKYWFEQKANIPTQVEIASEYRYRKVAVARNTLLVIISQSGETADTNSVVLFAQENPEKYLGVLAICNVAHSFLVRSANWSMLTQAGPEYGVASTKAFSAQLSALYILCGIKVSYYCLKVC